MAIYSVGILGFFFSLIFVPLLMSTSDNKEPEKPFFKSKDPHHFLKG